MGSSARLWSASPQKGVKHPSYTTIMVTFLLLSLQCPCEIEKPTLASGKKVTALASFLVLLYLEHQRTQLEHNQNAGKVTHESFPVYLWQYFEATTWRNHAKEIEERLIGETDKRSYNNEDVVYNDRLKSTVIKERPNCYFTYQLFLWPALSKGRQDAVQVSPPKESTNPLCCTTSNW